MTDHPGSDPGALDTRLESKYLGTLLGSALGDAYGAPREGGPLERLLWLMIGRTLRGKRRWTDDTQMSLDLAESIIQHDGTLVRNSLAEQFAASYRWSRGYGPAASRVLAQIRRGVPWAVASRSVYSEGSFGNGGAMRAHVTALIDPWDLAVVAKAARESAAVTHAHELAQDGAAMIATATALAITGHRPRSTLDHLIDSDITSVFREKLRAVTRLLQQEERPQAPEVVADLGNGVAATESVPLALYAINRFAERPFDELLRFLRACRGDVDTTSAMAGAIYGATNGVDRLPRRLLARLEQRERIETTAQALLELYRRRPATGRQTPSPSA